MKVVNVYRNKRYTENGWKSTKSYDTREVICKNCGCRYLVESVITRVFSYDKGAMRSKLIDINNKNYQLFGEK